MMGFLWLVLFVLIVLVGLRVVADQRRRPGRVVEAGTDPRRLERVESALASLEGRLEELQDQQRFLERLLAERRPPGALPPGSGGGEGEEGEDPDSILFDTDRRDT